MTRAQFLSLCRSAQDSDFGYKINIGVDGSRVSCRVMDDEDPDNAVEVVYSYPHIISRYGSHAKFWEYINESVAYAEHTAERCMEEIF
jgi:hypothetical protein